MFNFSFWDIVLILMLSLIIFGPNKLPDIAKSLGKGIYEFRNITSKVSESIKEETESMKNEVNPKESTSKDKNNEINLNK